MTVIICPAAAIPLHINLRISLHVPAKHLDCWHRKHILSRVTLDVDHLSHIEVEWSVQRHHVTDTLWRRGGRGERERRGGDERRGERQERRGEKGRENLGGERERGESKGREEMKGNQAY